jgi:hypothetical protein
MDISLCGGAGGGARGVSIDGRDRGAACGGGGGGTARWIGGGGAVKTGDVTGVSSAVVLPS